MAEDLGEKTEDATPRKILKARDDGRIAKSVDLAGALLLTFVTLLLWVMAAPSIERLGGMLEFILMTSGDPHSHLGSVASIIGPFDQLLVLTFSSSTPVHKKSARGTGQIPHVQQQNRLGMLELSGPHCAA